MKNIQTLVSFAFTAIMLAAQTPSQVNPSPIYRKVIPENFVTSEAVFIDGSNVFLGSAQGSMPVFQNSPPLFQMAAWNLISSAPINSIRGDGSRLYVTSADGRLYVLNEQPPFLPVAIIPYGGLLLNSLAVDPGPNGFVTFSEGQGSLATNSRSLYFSKVNQGDIAVSINKTTFATQQTFAPPDVLTTAVFDRSTGARLGTIPNPTTGSTPTPVALYATESIVVQTVPGCCGAGIWLFDANTLAQLSFIGLQTTNVVRTMNGGRWLVAGTESGLVVIFDITNQTSPIEIGSIDLRSMFGQGRPDDFEVRSLAADASGRIFAASTWTNGPIEPTVASFVVLQVFVPGS